MLLKNIDTRDKLFNIIVTEQIVFEQSAVPVTTMCRKNLLQHVFLLDSSSDHLQMSI